MGLMHRRYLQPDGQSVIWHDAAGERAVIFSFQTQSAELPGKVRDLTADRDLDRAPSYELAPMHTYVVEASELPVTLSATASAR